MALIENDDKERHQIRIGDVLLKLYDIECIEKESIGEKYQEYPFKIKISCLSEKRDGIVNDLNEAISLLLMLKEKGMVSFIDSKSDKCFGDNTPKMYLNDPEHSVAPMIDCFDVNTWQLLNSYYYLSNSFKDYCQDFKTIEQRRHEREIKGIQCTNIIAFITMLIAFVTLVFTVCSCSQSHEKKTTDIKDNTNKSTYNKSPRELMADSIVSLSFQGFTLGEPLIGSLKKAQAQNQVWNIRRSGDVVKGRTKVMLLSPNKSLLVDFKIYTYHDTIYYIEYESSSDEAFGNIADLYIEKYGHYYDYDYDRPDATYNPNNNKHYTWSYSNQQINVSERDYVMIIRDYMMKDKETLQTFLDCRDHSVYVYYIDYSFQQKAHVADSIKREKEEIIRAKKQRVQDSIDEIKAKKRRENAIKQI